MYGGDRVPAALHEYRFLELQGLETGAALPADVSDRTIVFLDCGNIDRNPFDACATAPPHPQHRPPSRQHAPSGTVNHASPEASCTAERVIWDLMGGALGRRSPTLSIAEALYVGLVTDTGKFMYENTGPRAHAAWRAS